MARSCGSSRTEQDCSRNNLRVQFLVIIFTLITSGGSRPVACTGHLRRTPLFLATVYSWQWRPSIRRTFITFTQLSSFDPYLVLLDLPLVEVFGLMKSHSDRAPTNHCLMPCNTNLTGSSTLCYSKFSWVMFHDTKILAIATRESLLTSETPSQQRSRGQQRRFISLAFRHGMARNTFEAARATPRTNLNHQARLTNNTCQWGTHLRTPEHARKPAQANRQAAPRPPSRPYC